MKKSWMGRLRGTLALASVTVALVACDSTDAPTQTPSASSPSSATGTTEHAGSSSASHSSTAVPSSSSTTPALSVPKLSEAGFAGPVKASSSGLLDAARPSDQLTADAAKPGTYTIQVSCQGAPLTVTASESNSLRPSVRKTFPCDAPGSASHTARSTQAFAVHRAPLVMSVSSQGTTQFLVAVVEGAHVIGDKP